MDVLGSSAFVLQNDALTQNRLLYDSSALATGLRVRSAADDPSGYAIGQTIQTKVAGLQQSVTNVQTANNLLNVANGALNAVTSLLQRIRSLVVEANSDVNSSSDLANLQAEINQLLLEINKISSNVQFNGLTLFNGNFDNGTSGFQQAASITEISSPLPSSDGTTGGNQVSNSQIDQSGNLTAPGPGPFVEPWAGTPIQQIPALMVFQIIGYSDNAIDPDSGTAVGPGVYIQFSAYSQNPAFGAAPLYVDVSAVPINMGPLAGPFGYATYDAPSSYGGGTPYVLMNFALANLTAADVGATAAFISTNASPSASGTALTVNDGGGEGQIVSVSLPSLTTNSLNISDISVQTPATINYTNAPTGPSQSNAIAASDAEARIDAALQQVADLQAYVGSQAIALNFDQTGDTTAILNLTTAVSNIRDANIGQTVTDFTKQQILVSVGAAVLSHIEVDALQVSTLLLDSISGAPSTGSSSGGTSAGGSVA